VPKLLLNSFGFEFRCGLVVPPDKVRMGFRASGMIFMRMFPRNLVRMTGIGMLVLVLRRWIGDAVVLVVAEFVRLVLMSLMIGGMPLLHRRLRVPPREVRTSLLVVLEFVRLVLMSLMIGGMPLLHRRLRVPPREVRTSLLVVLEFVRLVLMSLIIGGMPLIYRRLRVPPREVRTSLLVALVLVRRLRHETVLGAPASLRPLNDALPVPGLRALQQMHRIGSLHALGVLAWGGGGEG